MNSNNRSIDVWQDNWSPVWDFRREFDRFFDLGLTTSSRFAPVCEIDENPDHFLFSLEVPGVRKDDLKIEFVDNQIVVSGERRGVGKFQRSFTLPTGVNAEQTEASYQDGILQIAVPKAESMKPRQIKITAGTSASKFFGKLLGKSKETEEAHLSQEPRDQVAS